MVLGSLKYNNPAALFCYWSKICQVIYLDTLHILHSKLEVLDLQIQSKLISELMDHNGHHRAVKYEQIYCNQEQLEKFHHREWEKMDQTIDTMWVMSCEHDVRLWRKHHKGRRIMSLCEFIMGLLKVVWLFLWETSQHGWNPRRCWQTA